MPFTQKDIGKLRWSLLLLAGSVLISGILGFLIWQMEQQAQASFTQQENQSKEMRNRLTTLRKEEADMRIKIERYQELANRGIIGTERRLDWIELMRSQEKTQKLLGLEYEISPQQPLAAQQLPGVSAGHDFMLSTMHMRMPLLHEDDLLVFLRALRNNAAAFVRPTECTIARVDGSRGRTSDQSGLSPQMQSECKVDWITLKEKK